MEPFGNFKRRIFIIFLDVMEIGQEKQLDSLSLSLCLSVSLLNIYHSTCFGWAGYVEEFTTGIGEAIFLAIFATRPAATIQSC